MKEFMNFKGHFTIQAIDKDNNVVDEWADNNMIMETARETMAELFANLETSTFINKFKLGTLGHVGTSILIPKGKDDGFTKERTRLFSETLETAIESGEEISILRKNDVIFVEAIDPELTGFYRFIGEFTENYTISDTVIVDEEEWEFIGEDEPYTYNIGFSIPRTNDGDGDSGGLAEQLVEDNQGSGSTVYVKQQDSSVTFTIDIATDAANLQNENTSVFTEAALYANDRIFAMKTFKAKVKDSTVLLRIIWTITF
jgi:hypothetical protein